MPEQETRGLILTYMAESGGNFTPIMCRDGQFEHVQEVLRLMRDRDKLIFGFRCRNGLPGDRIITVAEKDTGFRNGDERLLFLTNDWEAERELPLWNV